MSRERPILFSAPMVRAILAGQKTQTRRVVKLPHQNSLGEWQPTRIGGPDGGRTAAGATIPEQGAIWHTRTGEQIACPYGAPGDRLWVRESLKAVYDADGHITGYAYASDDTMVLRCPDLGPQFSDGMAFAHLQRPGGVPSIHMPRWASRITLEITDVRVERLQAISEADARAEGVTPEEVRQFWLFGADEAARARIYRDAAVRPFRALWESINGVESWTANPWGWVVEFRRVES